MQVPATTGSAEASSPQNPSIEISSDSTDKENEDNSAGPSREDDEDDKEKEDEEEEEDEEDFIGAATYNDASEDDVERPKVVLRRVDISHTEMHDYDEPQGETVDLLEEWIRSNEARTRKEQTEQITPAIDPPPHLMTTELHPHQRQGLAWLVEREKNHPTGGILADDQVLVVKYAVRFQVVTA